MSLHHGMEKIHCHRGKGYPTNFVVISYMNPQRNKIKSDYALCTLEYVEVYLRGGINIYLKLTREGGISENNSGNLREPSILLISGNY